MSSIFDDIVDREQKLLDQLSSCPIVEIIGLVSISGVGAGKIGKEPLWSMTIKFDAWRIYNGKIEKDLTVRRKVTDEELKIFQKAIKAESIIKIRGRVSKENIFDSAQAMIEEYIQSDIDDVEINKYLMEIRKPVIYRDDLLGTFTYDRQVKWYTNSILWVNKMINLNLSIEKMDELDEVLKVAHILYKDQIIWNKKIIDYAVSELLPLKNESWLEEDEVELTDDQFKKRMKLETVTVYEDGSYEFWHNDSDMFWGHSILISGNIIDGPNGADIPG